MRGYITATMKHRSRAAFLFALSVPLAGALAAGAAKQEGGASAQRILLDQKAIAVIQKFKIAPRLPITIELPAEPELPVRCADCAVSIPGKPADKKSGNLFLMDVDPPHRLITIQMLKLPGWQPDKTRLELEEIRTAITVRIPAFGLLKIDIEATKDPAEAAQTVIFEAPGLDATQAFVKEQVDAAKKELEEKYAARVKAAANAELRKAWVAKKECDARASSDIFDLLVVKLVEVCWLEDRTFLVLEIDNREKGAPLAFESVVLKASAGVKGQLSEVPVQGQFLSALVAEFDQPVRVLLELPAVSTRSFGVHLAEISARGRSFNFEVTR